MSSQYRRSRFTPTVLPTTFIEGEYSSYSVYDSQDTGIAAPGVPSIHIIYAGSSIFFIIDYTLGNIYKYTIAAKTLALLPNEGAAATQDSYNTESGVFAQISDWQSIFGKYTVFEKATNPLATPKYLEIYKYGTLLQKTDISTIVPAINPSSGQWTAAQPVDISPDGKYIIIAAPLTSNGHEAYIILSGQS